MNVVIAEADRPRPTSPNSDAALGLTSWRVTLKMLRDNGFTFRFANSDAALADLVG